MGAAPSPGGSPGGTGSREPRNPPGVPDCAGTTDEGADLVLGGDKTSRNGSGGDKTSRDGSGGDKPNRNGSGPHSDGHTMGEETGTGPARYNVLISLGAGAGERRFDDGTKDEGVQQKRSETGVPDPGPHYERLLVASPLSGRSPDTDTKDWIAERGWKSPRGTGPRTVNDMPPLQQATEVVVDVASSPGVARGPWPELAGKSDRSLHDPVERRRDASFRASLDKGGDDGLVSRRPYQLRSVPQEISAMWDNHPAAGPAAPLGGMLTRTSRVLQVLHAWHWCAFVQVVSLLMVVAPELLSRSAPRALHITVLVVLGCLALLEMPMHRLLHIGTGIAPAYNVWVADGLQTVGAVGFIVGMSIGAMGLDADVGCGVSPPGSPAPAGIPVLGPSALDQAVAHSLRYGTRSPVVSAETAAVLRASLSMTPLLWSVAALYRLGGWGPAWMWMWTDHFLWSKRRAQVLRIGIVGTLMAHVALAMLVYLDLIREDPTASPASTAPGMALSILTPALGQLAAGDAGALDLAAGVLMSLNASGSCVAASHLTVTGGAVDGGAAAPRTVLGPGDLMGPEPPGVAPLLAGAGPRWAVSLSLWDEEGVLPAGTEVPAGHDLAVALGVTCACAGDDGGGWDAISTFIALLAGIVIATTAASPMLTMRSLSGFADAADSIIHTARLVDEQGMLRFAEDNRDPRRDESGNGLRFPETDFDIDLWEAGRRLQGLLGLVIRATISGGMPVRTALREARQAQLEHDTGLLEMFGGAPVPNDVRRRRRSKPVSQPKTPRTPHSTTPRSTGRVQKNWPSEEADATPRAVEGSEALEGLQSDAVEGWMAALGTPGFDVLEMNPEVQEVMVAEMFWRLGLVEGDKGPAELLLGARPTSRLRGLPRRDEGLGDSPRVRMQAMGAFVRETRKRYFENPYHNWSHAVDVTHNVFMILSLADPLRTEILTWLDALCVMVAALAHDMGHRGVTNTHLVKRSDVLALTYNDKSPQENMHVSALMFMFRSMPETNVFAGIPERMAQRCRTGVIELILQTDMAYHFELVSALEKVIAAGRARAALKSWRQAEDRLSRGGRSIEVSKIKVLNAVAPSRHSTSSPMARARYGMNRLRAGVQPEASSGSFNFPPVSEDLGTRTMDFQAAEVQTILQAILHTADLGHSLKPVSLHVKVSACTPRGGKGRAAPDGRLWAVAAAAAADPPPPARTPPHPPRGLQWVARVMSEFFAEAEVERSEGMTPAAFMDRTKCHVPTSQMDFLKLICRPLVAALVAIMPEAGVLLTNIHEVYAFWGALLEADRQ